MGKWVVGRVPTRGVVLSYLGQERFDPLTPDEAEDLADRLRAEASVVREMQGEDVSR